MLIDMDFTIAYKCFCCGTFDFTNINLFKFHRHKSIIPKCRCEGTKLEIFEAGRNTYKIIVPCIGCGEEHELTINREDITGKDIMTYTCPITNIKQCFIGRDSAVREHVDNFEKELDIIIDGLGYENYFINTQVMIETLNKIHDIAEQDGLRCQCGCNDIGVFLLRKGIYLKCHQCSGNKFIPAASNSDLKKTIQRVRIILADRKTKINCQSKV
ncbi:hypothetical protein LY28_02324 [Ruminiclostridium sufflavum DSM 19573]|uniref:Uncharacterized protein n=1 Tax=Ruminiclostridium sufflavum DSM 19573 TaxID=1121337 RepID=A0A318XKW5_9FIRM|nr:hypothetical protein [Ruminiclostridium sufflavum]PYG87186.1 hypothetical protein LY28_02324 [Ruminiclostridium sufflavum DSM 19573]